LGGNPYQPPYHYFPFGKKTLPKKFHEDWIISTGASSALNVYGFLYGKIMHKSSITLHRRYAKSILNALFRQYNSEINSVMLLTCFTTKELKQEQHKQTKYFNIL
jgi:hypothetical protein